MDTHHQVRAAVIGYGGIGSAHTAGIAQGRVEGMTLAAVCDVRPARLEAAAQRFPGVRCVADYHALLDGSIDAVVIAVPHPMHCQIAADCLRAGVHVLSEKPLDISVTAAKKALQGAEESGSIFAVMLNQRTAPIFQRAREIVQSGQLGQLKRTVWIITNWYRTQHYYDSGAWRATWAGEGGGVLLNQAPHNLDLWQWICGMPASVTAFCDVARYHRIEVEDDATVMTRYENGATGLFVTSTGEYPGTNRLEIAGDGGKLVLEEGVLKWWKLRESEHDVRWHSDGSMPKIPLDYTEERFEHEGAQHLGILQNFTNAILLGETLISPAAGGLNELMLSNAAYLSQWTGNACVALPLDGAAFDALLDEHAANSMTHEDMASIPDGAYQDRWQTRW
ncbi:MAG: Gfo/Idh/MocA family oxidoreductase [Clostridia bacterium]|nr:Gfo/Idh/MocA family oxidoreductase [Clostridia bacterium]